MLRIENGVRSLATVIDRLSVESSLFKKIKKNAYRNYITLTYQKNDYGLTSAGQVANTSLQINSSQSFSISKNFLFANLNYTNSRNRSQYVFFNTAFNGDVSYAFQLFKRIMASSGIVYASVVNWYQQVGIRQTFSGDLNKRFTMSLYVDARRNLKSSSSFWNDPVHADISIKYLLKNLK
jgi:hypothetical protein